MRITHCRTNHLSNPLGYLLDRPVFSYQVEGATGKRQASARIRVSMTPDMTAVIYDTGDQPTIDSLQHPVDIPLHPRTRYYWDVAVRTEAGETAQSDVQWFETAMRTEPWQAQWVTCDSQEPRHPVFSKQIEAVKPVKTARLYVCGLGLYEVMVDGVRVGDEYFTPYCNNYHHWLQYQTFDLTEALQAGGCLQVLLGNGWYKGRFGLDSSKRPEGFYADDWMLIAQLHLLHDDGSETVIGTDESWQVTRSQIVFSNLYDGEVLDQTLPPLPAVPAWLAEAPDAPLTERLSPPVTVHERLEVAALLTTPAGETVLDLGQNFAGIFELSVDAPQGARIHLQFGEILQNGNFYRDNLRTALQEYTYVSDGTPRILRPHFTFYGYRYVKVEGLPNLRREDFTGLALYSDIPAIGSISTGSKLVNQLISNTMWGQKSNFLDVPTDCPQRDERMGWTGDAQAFAGTACYLTDCYAFFRKFMHDLGREQEALGGKVPIVVPSFGMQDSSAVWSDAACIIPWILYQHSGDPDILRAQYSSMRDWVDAITAMEADNHSWRKQFHFGDWLALDNPVGGDDQVMGGTDTGFIASVYYAFCAQLVSQAALVLDQPEDAKRYEQLAEQVRKEIRAEYFSVTGRPCISTQTGLLLALMFDLAEDQTRLQDDLKYNLAQHGNKLRTGFTGTPLLCPVLSAHGMVDIAYDLLLNEEYPGWLYSVKLGATTIWERWNSLNPDGSVSSTGMNSFNHYAYGSIVEWLFQWAAGIQPAKPGFRSARLVPQVSYALRFLEAELHSAAGTYRSAWRVLDSQHVEVNVTVPFGCTAELQLPASDQETIYLEAGEHSFSYRTNRSLKPVYSTDSPIRELLKDPEAKALLLQFNPQVEQMPSYMHNASLRQIVARYADSAETQEMLQVLDKKLLTLSSD